MNFKDVFSKDGILKIGLICLTILLWVYFYISSSVSLDLLIIFDLPSIVNTFLTTEFLLFLITLPLTSAIIISFSTKDERAIEILQISIGIALGFLISGLFFTLGKYFVLFAVLYLLAHILLSFLIHSKFNNGLKKISSLSSYANSKLALLLTVTIFIVIVFMVTPAQQEYAEKMEAGIVNMFVGDDLGNWLGTSFSIGTKTTKSNLDYITSQVEYQKLRYITNSDVQDFIDFMDDFENDVDSNNKEDIESAYANLESKEVKNEVFNTIDSMPIMVIVKQYFALISGIVFASLAQIYFSIAFSLLGLLYVYIFYKIFTKD